MKGTWRHCRYSETIHPPLNSGASPATKPRAPKEMLLAAWLWPRPLPLEATSQGGEYKLHRGDGVRMSNHGPNRLQKHSSGLHDVSSDTLLREALSGIGGEGSGLLSAGDKHTPVLVASNTAYFRGSPAWNTQLPLENKSHKVANRRFYKLSFHLLPQRDKQNHK